MYDRSPRAISQEAGGDPATICLPSRLSRVRAPSPALYTQEASSQGASQEASGIKLRGILVHMCFNEYLPLSCEGLSRIGGVLCLLILQAKSWSRLLLPGRLR